jgi:hypothetical protein
MSLTVKQLSEDCWHFAKYINENQEEINVSVECKVFDNGTFDVLILTGVAKELILEVRWSEGYSKWYPFRRRAVMNVIRVVEWYVENSMNKGYSKLFKFK